MIILEWIMLCLRILIAVIFITYGYSKLRNLSNFAAVIRSHHLIPEYLSKVAAYTLPYVEIALGCLLLFNILPIISGIVISSLLLFFDGILLRAYFTPQLGVVTCGCSGLKNRTTSIERALFRNTLLLGATIAIIIIAIISRNRDLLSSLIIEIIVFICTVIGEICTQMRIFSFFSRVLTTHQQEQEDIPIIESKSNRRIFIKWGLQFGATIIVSTSIFLEKTLNAFAADPCPQGSGACDCGQNGSGPWSGQPGCSYIYDCMGQTGIWVPLTIGCLIYCCGIDDYPCDYQEYPGGSILCNGGGC